MKSRLVSIGAVLGLALLVGHPAFAADKVRAAKAAANAWTFTVLEIGAETGIWASHGLDVESIALAGDAKLQQALAADSVDLALGSGPSMAFSAKGAPAIAVAAFAGEPRNLSVVVGYDSPLKTVKDLKDKLLSVTTTGSLTEWLAKRLAINEGFGADGIKTVALGAFPTSLAALRTGQIDGMMTALESGYALEEQKAGRVVTDMGKYAPHFHTHVVFARRKLIEENPALVTKFLQGFFATVAFMKANRDKTIDISMKVLNVSHEVTARTYDYEMSMFSDDGRFDPEAIKVLKESFVEMGVLPSEPKDDEIYTGKFTPVKP